MSLTAPGRFETESWREGRTLGSLLALTCAGDDRFTGWCHAGFPGRAFGGIVAAQALMAAGRTVAAGQAPHSLHAYFLLAGDPDLPMEYAVERVRDGRCYATRRVTALQRGEAVFTLTASFKLAEQSVDRQTGMPSALVPEQLPDLFEVWGRQEDPESVHAGHYDVLDLRLVRREEVLAAPVPGLCRQHTWFRSASGLPDDPLLHAGALVYASDLLFAPTAALEIESPRPVRSGPSQVFMTSLDHSVWFHRPFRADEWLLFDQRSPSTADGRGMAMGELWSRDGSLVASVAQEAVMRPMNRRGVAGR